MIYDLGVFNRDTEPHTFDLRIRDTQDVVFTSTAALEASDGTEPTGAGFSPDWPSDPRPYTISARIDDKEWRSIGSNLGEGKADCYSIRYLINEQGLLTPFTESCADLGVETTDSASE